jgi:hypothetical protein
MTEVTLFNGRSLSQFTRVEWALVPSGQSSSTSKVRLTAVLVLGDVAAAAWFFSD